MNKKGEINVVFMFFYGSRLAEICNGATTVNLFLRSCYSWGGNVSLRRNGVKLFLRSVSLGEEISRSGAAARRFVETPRTVIYSGEDVRKPSQLRLLFY